MKLFIKFSLALLIFSQILSDAALAYQAPNYCEKDDPYQSLYTPESLKAKFLRRITNDPTRLDLHDKPFGEAFTDGVGCWYSSPTLDGWHQRNQDVLDKKYPEGVTLYTSNSADTQQLFRNIANRIKLKLVS